MSVEKIVRYREEVGFRTLADLLLDAAKCLGELHRHLPRHLYEEMLDACRAKVAALLSAIPEDAYDGVDFEEVLAEVERMDRKQLLKLVHRVSTMLDRKGLAFGAGKKVKRVNIVED